MAVAFLSLVGCNNDVTLEPYTPSLTDEEIKAGVFTPEVMLKMGRVADSKLSPDGTSVLYSVTSMDVADNQGYTSLYILNADSLKPRRITEGKFKDYNACWAERGNLIYFLSNRSGKTAIWSIKPDGTNMQLAVNPTTEINAFDISPKGDMVWYTTQIKVDVTAKDLYPMYKESQVMIYDDLMARHWNYWLDGTFSHIIVGKFDGKVITDSIDIMKDEPWDAPLAPYFDISEITWNNEGTQIAYTAKKLHGYNYAVSTNSDIYLYDIASKTTRNLTEGMPGYDRNPLFSPSDGRLSWISMERPGNESDKARLFVVDIATSERMYITQDFDYNAASVQWADNNTLYFISPIEATHQICRATIEPKGNVTVLTEGLHDFVSLSLQSGKMIAEMTTLSMAAEVFEVDPQSGEYRQRTFTNQNIYKNIKMGEVQKRWITTSDDKRMLTWVVLPPEFSQEKKYPALLFCEGGPQSVVSQSWSYRWNFQLMASQGYVIVAPNRRGLPSFGQEWLDQISGDYSGQNISDYLSAIDNVSSEKWVDKNRLGCVGASYGGYSVYYLAGHHSKRFKAFISHCGMFNFESFYGSTEELWFPTNDLGGPYWSEDATAKRSYAQSPHRFVDRWDTPIMIMVGAKDYRIPYTESLQAFTAARANGVEARIVVFEDEGHQVFKPQNAMVWHTEYYKWLEKYVKNPVAKAAPDKTDEALSEEPTVDKEVKKAEKERAGKEEPADKEKKREKKEE